MKKNKTDRDFEVPKSLIESWQKLVNLIADLLDIPSALIMKIVKEDIEVFISSKSKENPYTPGDKEHLEGSGLYCETVIKTKDKLLVSNALNDKDWKNNPDVSLNMISYLGFPIKYPDGKPFGTICVLDNKENSYSDKKEAILKNFRDVVENQLSLSYMNHIMGQNNKEISDYLNQLVVMRAIIPICSSCKKIRTEEGEWEAVEKYIAKSPESNFTHGLCPDCTKKLESEIDTME